MLTKEELKDIYEKRYTSVSQDHSAREIAQYRKYYKVLLNWDSSSCSDKHYLDLGCGLGAKTVGFNNGFKVVKAVDLSETAIDNCRNKFSDKRIEWVAGDAMSVPGKYELITAFGFSLFNTPDNQEFVSNVGHIIRQNLSDRGGVMIVGSFTDLSGSGDSWYMHSQNDLNEVQNSLETEHAVKVEVIFPHRRFSNYFSGGLLNFIAELRKLVLTRRRNFFIKIVHG